MNQVFTVLLVDDIQQNLDALSMMILDEFEIKILTSKSAQDAIAQLMVKDIDLILTDIQMPDIDGFEFAEYLKGLEQTKDIPLILITGIYNKAEYIQKGYDLGAVEYITKPINNELLTSKLKVYIKVYEEKLNDKKQLKEKNEIIIYQSKMAAMGEMIGVIAHQLKQPLNVLSLFCQDVKSSFNYGDINKDFVEDFDENTKLQIQFLSKTIDDFRDFFNPNKVKKEFDIEKSIEKILFLLEKQLEINNIEISKNIQSRYLFGVESEFEQIVLNLVSNAQDALVENEITDKKILIQSSNKEDSLVFMVEDNAGGVANNLKDKIFNPYFTTKEKGTGVGLYMVKLVVESSFRAQINLEDGAYGARFVMKIPKNI